MPLRAFIAYDFALTQGTAFANVLEDARDTQPPDLDIHYPGDDGSPKEQGTIWGSLVKQQIDLAEKFIAFVDLPNANVGFEIGYACGLGKPVGVYRYKDSEHTWLKQHPLRGHFRHRAESAKGIHDAFLKDKLIQIFGAPKGGNGVTVLCPSDGGPFLRQIDETWGWKKQPLATWNLDNDLPKQFADTGLVVWIITPHGKGEAERDGTENTCLSILAGYAEARPEIELRIFIHTAARAVADLEHCSERFTTNVDLKKHLTLLQNNRKAAIIPNPPSTAIPTRAGPFSKPGYFPSLPDDLFRHDEDLFIGRESELKIGAESVAGMIERHVPGDSLTDRGFRLIWVHGFGGMGKSWYLHRLRCRAEDLHPEIVSLVVDWDKPDWRAPLSGEPRMDADLFDVIATRLCQKIGQDAANPYWQEKDRIDTAKEEHRKELDRFGSQLQIAYTDDTTRLEPHFQQLLIAETLWHDDRDKRIKKLGLLQKDSVRYREVFGAWCKETGHTDMAVICPGRARADGLRKSLRDVMQLHPIILLLDTCEILSHDLDAWLRELLAPLLREPLPLLVLIGSRLRPDLHQRQGSRKGWREEIPQAHLTPFDFGEGRRFTVTEIEIAINKLIVPFAGTHSTLSEKLHKTTLGIPIAVRALLDMHNEGNDVLQSLPDIEDDERVLSERDELHKVIEIIAERFLLNLTRNPEREDDLRDIIALSLLPSYDSSILAELWGDKPAARIRDLAGRYSLLSDGDLHPSVRHFLRRHWRRNHNLGIFDSVLHALRLAATDVRATLSPARPDEQLNLAAMDLNLRSWSEGDTIVDDLARKFCLARTIEADTSLFETLLTELPLAGPEHLNARKLWHRDQEIRPSDTEIVSWLKIQSRASGKWSEEDQGNLAFLEGISTATRPNTPDRALIALASLKKAIDVFGIENLPRRSDTADAFFNCGWTLDPLSGVTPADSPPDWTLHSIKSYEQCLILDPHNSSALNNVANLYVNQPSLEDNPEKSEKAYLSSIEIMPDSALPHDGLGNLYLHHLKEYEKAESELLTAISIDPNLAGSHFSLGVLYRDHLNKLSGAELHFSKAIEIKPENPYYRNQLCFLYQHFLEDFEKAKQEYHNAISALPKLAFPHIGLGSLYHHYLESFDQAEREYLKAIDLEPNLSFAHTCLGSLYEMQGRWVEAKNEFSIDSNLDKSSASGQRGLAWISLLAHNDIAQASHWADLARLIEPKHASTELTTLAIHAWKDDWATAGNDFLDWVSNLPRNKDHFPLYIRNRVCALLKRAVSKGQISAFAESLRHVSSLECWRPWNEALEAISTGSAIPVDPRAASFFRLFK